MTEVVGKDNQDTSELSTYSHTITPHSPSEKQISYLSLLFVIIASWLSVQGKNGGYFCSTKAGFDYSKYGCFSVLHSDRRLQMACAKDVILSHPASTSSLCLELVICSIVILILPSLCDSYVIFALVYSMFHLIRKL